MNKFRVGDRVQIKRKMDPVRQEFNDGIGIVTERHDHRGDMYYHLDIPGCPFIIYFESELIRA